ncbi:MAG TPA: hypothetical protein DCQ31_09905 [Bacteroidales bacterium]|nr:hypothetical protein [Bacteroidales bacterium]
MNKQQELVLELISLARNNRLNGKQIHKDLIKNQHLWISVYGFFGGLPVVTLRDMYDGYFHIDSIYIMCRNVHVTELETIIKHWNPHDINVTNTDFVARINDEWEHNLATILVWWD